MLERLFLRLARGDAATPHAKIGAASARRIQMGNMFVRRLLRTLKCRDKFIQAKINRPLKR